ncbi:HEAT repeat domain-containing protein, partial [Candidatus Poribacteria bacterium]|nr:HEAT repeat domain-containing protein [Candidatus Poribacteria bacterium]
NDTEWNVRRVSVRALLNIGERAVPQLQEALNDADADIRRFAAIALSQMEHRTR